MDYSRINDLLAEHDIRHAGPIHGQHAHAYGQRGLVIGQLKTPAGQLVLQLPRGGYLIAQRERVTPDTPLIAATGGP